MEQRTELTMQYEGRIKQLECESRNRVLEAESVVARHETEIHDEKSRRLELQARVTDLEALRAKDNAENRELRDRNQYLVD